MTYTRDRELRFLVTPGEAESVLDAAGGALVPEVHDPRRPLAYSRTTYLDTDDLEYLRTFDGPVTTRLRVRQYAAAASLQDEPVASPTAYLELKENAGTLRSKVRVAAPAGSFAELLRGDLQDDWLRRRLARVPELRDVERKVERGVLRPRLTTWYRRKSFSGDGIRVTLDEGLLFSRALLPVGANLPAEPTCRVGRGPRAILEVKLEGRAPGWLSASTCRLLAAQKFSKYRSGMKALARAAEVVRGVRTPSVPSLHTDCGDTPGFEGLELAHSVL